MLPKKLRFPLRKNQSFFEEARTVGSRYFVVYFQTGTAQQSRAAVITSKKQFPKATQRNAQKRRVRAGLKPLVSKMQCNQQPIDTVWFIKKTAANLEHQGLVREMMFLFRKIGSDESNN